MEVNGCGTDGPSRRRTHRSAHDSLILSADATDSCLPTRLAQERERAVGVIVLGLRSVIAVSLLSMSVDARSVCSLRVHTIFPLQESMIRK